MNGARRPWPPLVVSADVPRLVKWRDLLITLLMWGFFIVLLDTEFELLFSRYLEWLGVIDADIDPHWTRYFRLLVPYLLAVAVVFAGLLLFGLRTLLRGQRALLLRQPDPLQIAEEARRSGLDETALIAARQRRIVTVQIDADGSYRIPDLPPKEI